LIRGLNGTLASDTAAAYHFPFDPLEIFSATLLSFAISLWVMTILRVGYAGRQGQCGMPPMDF
jgi:hypothetical protein